MLTRGLTERVPGGPSGGYVVCLSHPPEGIPCGQRSELDEALVLRRRRS